MIIEYEGCKLISGVFRFYFKLNTESIKITHITIQIINFIPDFLFKITSNSIINNQFSMIPLKSIISSWEIDNTLKINYKLSIFNNQ